MPTTELGRPDLSNRRTLNAAIASLPYYSSAAYDESLRLETGPLTLLQANHRLCIDVDDEAALRAELADLDDAAVDWEAFGDVLERWRRVHLTEDETITVLAAAEAARASVDAAEDIDARSRYPQPLAVVVCVVVVVCVA